MYRAAKTQQKMGVTVLEMEVGLDAKFRAKEEEQLGVRLLDHGCSVCPHRLVGQVVKASASRAGGPRFESR